MRKIYKSKIFGVYLFGLRGSVSEVSLILTAEIGEVVEADCGCNLADAVACIAEHCFSGRTANVVKVIDNCESGAEIEAAAEKRKTELDAEAELTLRKRQAEAEAYEAEQKAKAVKAEADALKYKMLMEAEGIKAVGEAEAAKIKAVGEAEAKALDAKAKAYKNYNDTIKLQEALVEVLPEVAKK